MIVLEMVFVACTTVDTSLQTRPASLGLVRYRSARDAVFLRLITVLKYFGQIYPIVQPPYCTARSFSLNV